MASKRTAREPRYSVDLTDRAKATLKELAVRWGVSGSDVIELLLRKETGLPPFDHQETLRTVAEHLGAVGMPEARPFRPSGEFRHTRDPVTGLEYGAPVPTTLSSQTASPGAALGVESTSAEILVEAQRHVTERPDAPPGPHGRIAGLTVPSYEEAEATANQRPPVTVLDEPPPKPPAPLGPVVREPTYVDAPAWVKTIAEDLFDGAVVPEDAQEALRLWRHGVDVKCPSSYATAGGAG